MLIYLLALPFFFYYLLLIYDFDALTSDTVSNRMNALYLNLKPNSKLALFYTPLFLLRRLALALTITYCTFSPLLQCYLILSQSFFTLLFLIKASPFDSINGTIFEFMNEYTVLLVSSGVFACVNTDSLTIEVRYQLGWVLIALCLLNFIANLVNMVVKIYQGIKKAVSKKCTKMKAKKEQQEINQQEEEKKQLDEVSEKEGQKEQKQKGHKQDIKKKKISKSRKLEQQFQEQDREMNFEQNNHDEFEMKSNIKDQAYSNQKRPKVTKIENLKRLSTEFDQKLDDQQIQNDPIEESKSDEDKDQDQSFAQDTLEEAKINIVDQYLYHYSHQNMDPQEIKQIDLSSMSVAELIVYRQMQQENQKRKKKKKPRKKTVKDPWVMKGI